MNNATKGLRLIFKGTVVLAGMYAGARLGADVATIHNPEAHLRDVFMLAVAAAAGGAVVGGYAADKINDYVGNRISTRLSEKNSRPAEKPAFAAEEESKTIRVNVMKP